MPFAKRAAIELANDGDAEPHGRLRDHARAAHAADRASSAASTPSGTATRSCRPNPERAIDWTMLRTEGRGRFCGVMLHVWNPSGGWWGEGDEKFFVDGEKFPSTFGTGSEDYFGYAWSNPKLFQNAYHNQTICHGNNAGHVSVNRWHITDNVPFQKSFEGCIEKYYPNSARRSTPARPTGTWPPGGKDPYEPRAAGPAGRLLDAAPASTMVKGVLEGEDLKVLAKTGGDARPQDMAGFGAASGAATPSSGGPAPSRATSSTWPCPSRRPASTSSRCQLTKAVDYGIVQLSLDGKKLGEPDRPLQRRGHPHRASSTWARTS